MAIIAEFSVPTHSFALAQTLPEFPTVAVEADRIAAHVPNSTLPCLWAVNDDGTAFADALAADDTVERIESTLDYVTEQLYQVTWSDDINRIVTEMIDHQGVILEAFGRDKEWKLRIRFMAREQFLAFREYFAERDPAISLQRLFEAKHPRHTRGDVTPEQHEALTTAVELGYFRIPREASIQEVANALNVSDQAVSERIRRGTENLVCDMLAAEPVPVHS